MRPAHEIFQQLRETNDESKSYTRVKLTLEVMLDVRELLSELLAANKRAEEKINLMIDLKS